MSHPFDISDKSAPDELSILTKNDQHILKSDIYPRQEWCTPDRIVIHMISGGNIICHPEEHLKSAQLIGIKLLQIVVSTYIFMEHRFGSTSRDNEELPDFYIGLKKENATWTLSSSLTNRCIWIFNNIHSLSPIVVAHEYTRTWLRKLTPLGSTGEAGALFESCTDIMAKAFDSHIARMKMTKCNWKMGEFRDLSKHIDLRSFIAVQKYTKENDFGAVHHNSRILGHAFCTSVTLLDDEPDGIIADIWFRSLRRAIPDETFTGFAFKTIHEAHALQLPSALQAIVNGWIDVGVIIYTPPPPIPIIGLLYSEIIANCKKRFAINRQL